MQAIILNQVFREKGRYSEVMPGGRPATKPQPKLGQRISALRKERGLSQPQLAKLLACSREVVSYYERRATNPTAEFLEKLADIFEVSVASLLGEESSKKGKPGPSSQLEARLDQVRQLPRQRQKFILDFIDTVLRDSTTDPQQ